MVTPRKKKTYLYFYFYFYLDFYLCFYLLSCMLLPQERRPAPCRGALSRLSSIADAGLDDDEMFDGRTRVLHAETLTMHSRSMPQWLLHARTILLLLYIDRRPGALCLAFDMPRWVRVRRFMLVGWHCYVIAVAAVSVLQRGLP